MSERRVSVKYTTAGMQALAKSCGLRVAVGIATIGRPTILVQTLARIYGQTRIPDAVVVCAPSPQDVEGVEKAYPDAVLILGPRGLTRQRNAILRHLDGFDVVIFFDDDFIPSAKYVAAAEAIMLLEPGVVMATGNVVSDGILGPGLSLDEADAALDAAVEEPAGRAQAEDVPNGYGCNMCARLDTLRRHGIRFDETLPLYGWLEDVDFGQQASRHGRVIRSDTLVGVHLGVKAGRQSGLRLGYSQIANPVYLARKGTCPWRRALFLMSRNVAANTVRSLKPEAWVDRRGRLAGNLLAIADLVRGRIDPRRVVSL